MKGNETESNNILVHEGTSNMTTANKQIIKKADSGNQSMRFENGNDVQDAVGSTENHVEQSDKKLGNIPQKDSGTGSSLAVENVENKRSLSEKDQGQENEKGLNRGDSGNESQNCISNDQAISRFEDKLTTESTVKALSGAHSVRERKINSQDNKRSLKKDDSGNDSQSYSPSANTEGYECEYFDGIRDRDKHTFEEPESASTDANGVKRLQPNKLNSLSKNRHDLESKELTTTQNDRVEQISHEDFSQNRTQAMQDNTFPNFFSPQHIHEPSIFSGAQGRDFVSHLPNKIPQAANILSATQILESITPPGAQCNSNTNLSSSRLISSTGNPNSSEPLLSPGANANDTLSLTSLLPENAPLVREIPNRAQVSRSILNQMTDELLKTRQSNQLLSQDLDKFQAEKRQWMQEKQHLEYQVQELKKQMSTMDESYRRRVVELEEEVKTVRCQKALLEEKSQQCSADDFGFTLRNPPEEARDRHANSRHWSGTGSQQHPSDQGGDNTEVKETVSSERGQLTHQRAISSIDEVDEEDGGIEDFDVDEDTEDREDHTEPKNYM